MRVEKAGSHCGVHTHLYTYTRHGMLPKSGIYGREEVAWSPCGTSSGGGAGPRIASLLWKILSLRCHEAAVKQQLDNVTGRSNFLALVDLQMLSEEPAANGWWGWEL